MLIQRVLRLHVCLLIAVSAYAQTTPNIHLHLPNAHSPNWNIPLNQNFLSLDLLLSGNTALPGLKTNTLTLPFGATNPLACTTAQIFFNTASAAGSNLYGCTATNTWTLEAGGGSGSPGGATGALQYNLGGSFGGLGLGTTSTVYHGNAAGVGAFAAVDLANDVSGNLAITRLNNGTSASNTTFWRGDGVWATPPAAGSAITSLTGDVTASGPGAAAATLASTAVTPGAYTSANITVDAKGRITAATNGSGGSSPLTTKGDLFGYSTLNARIPVGTNGQILTADSTQTLGLKWAAAGASNGFQTATFASPPTATGAGNTYYDTSAANAGLPLYYSTASGTGSWQPWLTLGPSGALAWGGTPSNVIDIDTTVVCRTTNSCTVAALWTYSNIRITPVHVAALGTCNGSTIDTLKSVDDAAATPVYNAAVTGGGSVHIPVYCNGSSWVNH